MIAFTGARRGATTFATLLGLGGLVAAAGCATSPAASDPMPAPSSTPPVTPPVSAGPVIIVDGVVQQPQGARDPRVGLRAGMTDAAEAVWNLRVLSRTPSPSEFRSHMNSDLAFNGQYAIQGNFGGFMVWDISNPSRPALRKSYVCPASQSDVSIFRNLLFVSGEDFSARLDCGTQGVQTPVSTDRLRGIRIFDISNLDNPRNVANVQTCRGSHTHTVLADPRDPENIYIYVSGSAPVRPADELAGCSDRPPSEDPNTALFRIEVIQVPLANPAQARIVSSPRIFTDLTEPPTHGMAPEDSIANAREVAAARARGDYIVRIQGEDVVLPPQFSRNLLDSLVRARGGTGAPTSADSTKLRAEVQAIVNAMIGISDEPGGGPRPGPTQCHDITVFPEVGLAGGACEGYGMLLDISNPRDPRRIAAAADSNFAYWHSATFNNDGTKVLFTDEWGGGSAPRCRATDRTEWGANAIFTIENRDLRFQSYYKLPAAQTAQENCVAHNGSIIPIPGRDVMVQAWYQGGISIFDWTDPRRPIEIAYHDRGPIDASRMVMGGSWSAYWYNGVIVSSEIARGLDILELTPSEHLSQNEIDAAKSVRLDYFNPQMQVKFAWPPTFSLARAYLDQLERANGLSAARIIQVRDALAAAERASSNSRRNALTRLATDLDAEVRGSAASKVRLLAGAVRDLAAVTR